MTTENLPSLQKRSGPATIKTLSPIFSPFQSLDDVTTESELIELKEHIEELRLGGGLGGEIPTAEQYEFIQEMEDRVDERRGELRNDD